MRNSSRTGGTTRAFPLHPLHVLLAALALLLPVLLAPARAEPGNDNRAPDLGECQDLQVEPGNKVAFAAFADGVQIYRWNGTSWIFVAPDADLYADAGENGEVITHFGGPTWETASGSRVVGSLLKECPADPDAIPWLLLKGASSGGPGILDGVTFIQRLNTVGGLAPTDRGDFVGEVAEVPYNAVYVFYRQSH